MKKIYILAAAALTLASCENNEDNPVSNGQAVKISASIRTSGASRASGDAWTPGDIIGISSVVGNVVGPYTNVKYTTPSGNGLDFYGQPLYYNKSMTLIAYYPFTGVEGTAPGTDGKIPASTLADNQKSETQPGIDFLWDSKTNIGEEKDFSASDPTVNFKFTHKMSQVTFAFKGSPETEVTINGIKYIVPEVKASDMVRYEISGLKMAGTFDTATGVCAVNDDNEPENLGIAFAKGTVKYTDPADPTAKPEPLAPVILFPQTFQKDAVLLHVYTDEYGDTDPENLQHYTCALAFDDGELKPGICYNYTIKITKVGLILEKMEIKDWGKSTLEQVATIDGDSDWATKLDPSEDQSED